jgi:hypothetical protein
MILVPRASAYCLIMMAVLLGGLSSCASYTDETREMREAYVSRDYDRALESLKKSGVMERSQDRLLWRLEAATILDRKGEPEKSRKLWLEADQIADELYTVSVSKTATSFVVNDASADYEGEDYEKVAIHSMLAHQFLGLGRMDEARVEAKKINNKLNEINQRYSEKDKNKYGEDAHARYLSGLIYEAKGDWDSAIIDYSKAVELYENDFKSFIRGPVPTGLVHGLYRVLNLRGRQDRMAKISEKYKGLTTPSRSGDAEIVVVHEVGRIARKFAKDFVLSIGGQVVRFSFPAIEPQAIYNAGTGIEIRGDKFYSADNTAYLDAIAYDTLENRRGRMMAKQMTRLLAKGQLTYQAEKNFGPLAGLAANIATAATETADTRSWTTLPQAFYISRARVPAGTHDITVKTNGRVGIAKRISLSKGEIVVMRSVD